MATQQTVAQRLYDLLITRGLEPETKNPKTGRDVPPAEARVMSFDFVTTNGRNYGTAVLVLGDEQELMLFYGDNLGRSMEPEDKDEWYQFMHQLKQFSTRNDFSTFTPRNLNQFKHHMASMTDIKEGLFESYYGTRQVSYMGEPTQARLMIRHNRTLGEGDARHRHIQALFIETQEGERFRLPFTSLTGGRAMLEHVRQGGRPYDVRGVHIADMIQEAKLLSRFRRASQGRVLEGVTQEVVTRADVYYQNLRENLRGLATGRGYQAYFETWQPHEPAQSDALVEDLKQLFVEQTLDARIEAVLPLLARLQETPMKEADIFENWATRLAEGTWSIPDTPESKNKLVDLLAQELPVGPDATNAREQLYDLFGDDELFDRLADLADRDPDADARDVIRGRASELGIELPEAPAQPAAPQPPAAAAQPATPAAAQTPVSEDQHDSSVDVDAVLSILRQTLSRLNSEGGWSDEAKSRFEDVYRYTRRELMQGDWPAAKDYLQSVGATNPDLFDAFVGAMWEAAGLPNNATWEEFEQAISDPVAEGDNLATFVGPNESLSQSELEEAPGTSPTKRRQALANLQAGANLHVGDDVVVTGPVQYQGATGVIEELGRQNMFAVVNLYNHGRVSFQASDLAINDYANSDEEQAELNRYGERDAGLFGDDDRDDDVREDSTDPMDHRGAVTDSFYEDLARIKSLALSK